MSVANPSGSFHPGQKAGLGRFILERELGRGGMGVVWLALDTELNEHVALKFIPPEIRRDAEALDELRRETQRCRKLTHPNIIRIHDFLRPEGEIPFIAMEYVEGKTLSVLKIEQPQRLFTWEKLKPIAAQLCHALEYAHGEGVVHRDLKPGNMMLDSRGRLKLADFGLAACISDSISRVSQELGSSGTPAYMSPQQMDGRTPKFADDIYALGATLYELLTSKPPFYTGDIFYQVRHLAPGPLEQRLTELGLTNDVPPFISALVMRCLSKDPDLRPQNISAVAEQIHLPPGALPAIDFSAPSIQQEAELEIAPPKVASSAPDHSPLKWPLLALVVIIIALGIFFFFRSGRDLTHSTMADSDVSNSVPSSALAAQAATNEPSPPVISTPRLRPGEWVKLDLAALARTLGPNAQSAVSPDGKLTPRGNAFSPGITARTFAVRAIGHFPKGAVWSNVGINREDKPIYQMSVGQGWGDWSFMKRENDNWLKSLWSNQWLRSETGGDLLMAIAVTEKDILGHIAEMGSGTRTGFLALPNDYSGQELSFYFTSNQATITDVEVMLLDGVPESQWPPFVREGLKTAKRPR